MKFFLALASLLLTSFVVDAEVCTAASHGDPHLATWDGLKYDAQPKGEAILLISEDPQLEIQARLEKANIGYGDPAVTTGVTVDGPGDSPTIQVSIAQPELISVARFGEKQNGFCVKSNGGDQNSGVIKLDDLDYNDTGDLHQQCLEKCAVIPGVTGCEMIWDQGNRGCYAHTDEIDGGGNGANRHSCYQVVASFGEKQNGFCVKSNGGDQNSGVIKLDDLDYYDTGDLHQQCLEKCAVIPGVTGCEMIWDQGNKGCYAHTAEIDRGNGANRHSCYLVAQEDLLGTCTGYTDILVGSMNCEVELLVDGERQSMMDYDGSDASVTRDGQLITIDYPGVVKVTMRVQGFRRDRDRCYINAAFELYDCESYADSAIGLLGSPNKNSMDDWMDSNGNVLDVPSGVSSYFFEPAFNYVKDNWIITNEADSIFTYDTCSSFETVSVPDEVYDPALEEIVKNPDEAAMEVCGDDIGCIIDFEVLGLEAAREYIENPAVAATASPTTSPTALLNASPTASVVPAGYDYIAGGCNHGGNYDLQFGQTESSCAEICRNDAACLSFELFREQDGTKTILGHTMTNGDCYLQSDSNHEGCEGYLYNVDLFVKLATASPTVSPTALLTAPYVKGDPHFMTWNGKTYDFHGVCDLVLASVATFGEGIGMDIHIRSERMRMWSFVSSVAVRIGQEIFEVTGGGKAKFFTNGVEGKSKSKEGGISLVSTISGFPIHWIYESGKGEKFAINLGNNEKISIGTWHSFVSVSFENARSETFKGSVGLLGSFSDGSKLARDGTTIISGLNEYGQEWQVRDSEPKLFHTKEGPQYPSKCNIPSSTEMRHRLGKSELTTNDAKNACINVNETEMELCIFDVLATNNKFTAGAY